MHPPPMTTTSAAFRIGGARHYASSRTAPTSVRPWESASWERVRQYPRMPRLLTAAAIVVALNLPFGFWRAGVRKFSRRWLVAVHAPVPLVIAVRLLTGLGWHLITFPILIGAFFTGQFVGGRLRRRTLPPSVEAPTR